MTPILDALVAALVTLILNTLLLARLRRDYPPGEAAFLRGVCTWGLLLRYAGAVALNIAVGGSSAFGELFWGDSYTYDAAGYLLARAWSGESYLTPSLLSVSGYGFQYFVGATYAVFGRNQLLVQFLNGTIGIVAALVIYAIARKLYTPGVARWAILFMCFFPQMIVWSCAMYKDPSILLCIAVCIYAVLRLRERFSPGALALFVAASLYLMTLRFYVFYMVVFAVLGTFLFSQRRGLLGGLLAQVLLVGVFLGAMVFGVRRETLQKQTEYFDLESLQRARLGQSMLGRSAYAEEIDVSTQSGVLAALPVGFVYLLFAPFPWSISGVRQLLTLPETLVWYALMPALVRGLLHTIRTRLRAALPMLVFAGTLTAAYAVFQSNVGTAYRQRTQISMFFFILMGVGIELKKEQRLRTSRPTMMTASKSPASPFA